MSNDVSVSRGGAIVFDERVAWLAAVTVAAAAAALYIWLGDWPPGTHADEMKKVGFILSGNQDFNHPILALETARIANYFFAYTDPVDTLKLARAISGIFGGIAVLATFVLGRLVLAPSTAIAAAVAVAVTPLILFHATFLKEDIYYTGPAILGLAALLLLVERPNVKFALITGFAFGVAVSAKYSAGLLLAFAIAILLLASKYRFGLRFRNVALILVTVVLVFAAINSSALIDIDKAYRAAAWEADHAAFGHDVVLPIWLTGGLMHLRESLLPGLGWPLLIFGLAGIAVPILSPTHRRPLAVIAGAAVFWYLVHEISPLKPYPNFERYMVPEGPLLVVLGAAFLEWMFTKGAGRLGPYLAAVALLISAVPAAYFAYSVARASEHDPRRVVPQIIGYLGQQTFFDKYVDYDSRLSKLSPDRSRPIEILVTSSFWYERLARHGADPLQPREVRDATKEYFDDAFRQPYLELATRGPSFGFLNPIIRIVALDANIDRLVEIGKEAIELDPYMKINIGP